MGASVVIERSTDSELFEAYVEEFLAPTLEEGKWLCSPSWGRTGGSKG